MKKILLMIFTFLCFIPFTWVNAQECKYSVTGTSLTDTNPNGTPASYTYNIVCVPDKSSKSVSCRVNTCSWSTSTTSKCTYEDMQTDVDYDDFLQGSFGCADSLYGIVKTSQVGSSYIGGYTKVNLTHLVSSSTKSKYSDVSFTTCLLTNKSELEEEAKNGNNDNHGNSNVSIGWDFSDGDCTSYLGDGSKGTPMYYLNFVFNLIKYAAIILLLVLTIVDFLKAIVSGKDDEIKKATSKTIKRVIICIIIFFLPTLINFLLELLGLSTNPTCGIGG